MSHNFSTAVIGLGAMGMGAAESCIRAGLTTYGVDLNIETLEKLKSKGAKAVAQSAVDFATDLDAVLLLVVNAKQVDNILFGEEGLAEHLKPNTAVMISSTISAQDAKYFSQKLTEKGVLMLDAPVSGGAAKAAKGEMTVMASGSEQAFEKLNLF